MLGSTTCALIAAKHLKKYWQTSLREGANEKPSYRSADFHPVDWSHWRASLDYSFSGCLRFRSNRKLREFVNL
jgi:hypothetical protein